MKQGEATRAAASLTSRPARPGRRGPGAAAAGLPAAAELPGADRRSWPSDDAAIPAAVTRDWVEEIERRHPLARPGARRSAARCGTDGAALTVRFAPGTDPDARRRGWSPSWRTCGAGSRPGGLWITPAAEAEGELFAIVWLTGAGRRGQTPRRGRGRCARSPASRRCRCTARGRRRSGSSCAARPSTRGEAAAVRAEVERSLRAPALGRVRRGGRRMAVVCRPGTGSTAWPVPARRRRPCRSAPWPTVRARWRSRSYRVRYQGRAGPRPLRLARPRRLLPGRGPRAAAAAGDVAGRDEARWAGARPSRCASWSAASPWRLLLASLAAAVAGGGSPDAGAPSPWAWRFPAAVAAAANAFWLAGIGLNVTTPGRPRPRSRGGPARRPAAPGAGRRASGPWPSPRSPRRSTVPVTVALASHELGPLLSEPARAFLLAVVGGGGGGGVGAPQGPQRTQRTRTKPPSVLLGPCDVLSGPSGAGPPRPRHLVLFAATAAYVAVALFGPSLLPKPADLDPDRGSLILRLRLPEGTTLDETERRDPRDRGAPRPNPGGRRLLEPRPGGRTPSSSRTSGAGDRQPDRLARLATRLRYGSRRRRRCTHRHRAERGRRRADRASPGGPRRDGRGGLHLPRRPAQRRPRRALLGGPRPAPRPPRGSSRSAPTGSPPGAAGPPGAPRPVAGTCSGRPPRWPPPSPGSLPPRQLACPASCGCRRGRRGRARRSSWSRPASPHRSGRRCRSWRRSSASPCSWDGPAVPPGRLPRRSARRSSSRGSPGSPAASSCRSTVQLPLNSEEPRLGHAPGDRPQPGPARPAHRAVDLERPSLSPGVWQSERVRLIAARRRPSPCSSSRWRPAGSARSCAAWRRWRRSRLGLLAATPLIRSGLGQADELTVFALAAALALALPAVGRRDARLCRRLGGPRGSTGRSARRPPGSSAPSRPWSLGLAAPTLGARSPAAPLGRLPCAPRRWRRGTALLASALLSPPCSSWPAARRSGARSRGGPAPAAAARVDRAGSSRPWRPQPDQGLRRQGHGPVRRPLRADARASSACSARTARARRRCCAS